MIELDEMSKIGFGAYRVSVRSVENENALNYAIKCGCNLIDTSSNYENGDSEKLIGQVLQKQQNDKIFVITKAGYINGENLAVLQKVNEFKNGVSDVVDISDSFKHSIHPDYLEAQIKVSLKRLNRNYIDGFLLHSPEYYFEQKNHVNTSEIYYKRIKKAFEFLEDKVKQGIIRYYGISSNTMSIFEREKATDLLQLISIAKQVSSNNHFKLIQFPYNIIENGASIVSDTLEKSLIDIAKDYGIKTFSNRPLNANSASGLLRLVIHDFNDRELNNVSDQHIHDECFDFIMNRLMVITKEADLAQFPMIAYLKDNWMTIPHEEAFKKLFNGSFLPFIELIYENDIPLKEKILFDKFKEISWKYCLRTASKRVVDYFKNNNYNNLLPNLTSKSLPANLCREYLNLGVEHVLVGMRKPAYIDELKMLFH